MIDRAGFANSGGVIFVDESAEEIATAKAGTRRQRRWVAAAGLPVGWYEAERAVWPVLVVVPAIDAEHVLEMHAAEDEDAVEAIGAESPDPALGVGVGVRGLDRRADHPDALRPGRPRRRLG
jgi:hypothetical protein